MGLGLSPVFFHKIVIVSALVFVHEKLVGLLYHLKLGHLLCPHLGVVGLNLIWVAF
jgi:hypothetical protein